MSLTQSRIFYNEVDHCWVHLWKDAFGRKWMATKAWSLFRVADLDEDEEDRAMRQIIKELEN